MIETCPTFLVYYVFSDRLLSNFTPKCFADAVEYVSLPRIKHETFIKKKFSLKFDPNDKKCSCTH